MIPIQPWVGGGGLRTNNLFPASYQEIQPVAAGKVSGRKFADERKRWAISIFSIGNGQ
jgi:hypothetical protein